MTRGFWHGITGAAILLLSAISLAAAPANSNARPPERSRQHITAPPSAAMPPASFQIAQTRARTARDAERERAKKLEAQKRKKKRSRRKRRKSAASAPAVYAPPPLKKPLSGSQASGPGVSLAATLTPGGAALTSGVVWTVEPLSGDDPPTVTDDPLPTLLLPAGQYRITAKLNDFLQSVEVEIPAQGIASLDLSFNAARLKVKVLPAKGAMPLQKARIRIIKIDVDGAPPVVDINQASFDDILPAGIYRIEAALGLARIAKDIGLTAGAVRTVELNLSVGYVRLRARPAPGQEPLPNVIFELLPANGLETVPKPLATKSGSQAVFTLPAGPYRVLARYGEASRRELVDVGANTFSDIILDLDAGQAVITLAEPLPDPGAKAAFRLVRHDGDEGPSLVLSRTGTRLDVGLPVGSYTVKVELRDGRRAEKPFLVEPGVRTEIAVALPSLPPAQLTLSAGLAGGGALPDGDRDIDISFSVRTPGTEKAVASGNLSQGATISVPAGNYEISAVHNPTGATVTTTISVNAGGTANLNLEFPLGIATLSLAEGEEDPAAEWVLTGIDGKVVTRYQGPATKITLKPGAYIVTLTSRGFANTAVLSITAGQTTTMVLPAK